MNLLNNPEIVGVITPQVIAPSVVREHGRKRLEALHTLLESTVKGKPRQDKRLWNTALGRPQKTKIGKATIGVDWVSHAQDVLGFNGTPDELLAALKEILTANVAA